MNKPYGIRAQLTGWLWPDVSDDLGENGIEIEVRNGVMEVGFDNESDREAALSLARDYLAAYSLRTGQKVTADFDQSWEVNQAGGKDLGLRLSDSVKLSGRLQVRVNRATIKGTARIVTQDEHDSASLTNDTIMVRKMQSDPTLQQAMRYYATEAIDDDKPLYGIYKSVEVIKKHLGGWDRLAALAGKSKTYVTQLTDTAQDTRHAQSPRNTLSEAECKQRALALIRAYADSILL